MAVNVSLGDALNSASYVITAKIARELDPSVQGTALQAAVHDIAVDYAEQWTKEHLSEIYAALDAKAIANMITIEVAKQVTKDITDKENK